METLNAGFHLLSTSRRVAWASLHRSPPGLASCHRFMIKCPLSYHAFNCTSQQGCCASRIQTRAASSDRSNQGSPIRAVPVQVAHELLNAGHRYLDVRTAEEFASGHIESAVNIPYMYKVGPGLTKNVKFLEDVGDKFGKDDEIVVGCQMGKRSQMAAEELVAAGFTGITDMAGGYLAWRQSGMPTKASV